MLETERIWFCIAVNIASAIRLDKHDLWRKRHRMSYYILLNYSFNEVKQLLWSVDLISVE